MWTPRRTLEGHPQLKEITDAHAKRVREYEAAAAKAKKDGTPPPQKKPGIPPSGLYNGMIAPLIPHAIRGAIWYQGEDNAGRPVQYRTLFREMIRSWRAEWGQGDFPFLFVQLANFDVPASDPGFRRWAELREAQAAALSLPGTGMAVAIDIGDAKDIHPRNKREVGRRLSPAALAVAYGKSLVSSGPLYDSMKIEGDKVRVTFRHADRGLVFRGDTPEGFALAGEDRRFHGAEAIIEGNTVVVRSSRVSQPAAVRYARADNPECNLFNKEGLPASPFRTDDWPPTPTPAEIR